MSDKVIANASDILRALIGDNVMRANFTIYYEGQDREICAIYTIEDDSREVGAVYMDKQLVDDSLLIDTELGALVIEGLQIEEDTDNVTQLVVQEAEVR